MNTSKNWRKRGFFMGFFFLFGFFAIGGIVMLLWNWLIPSLFHLSAITYWQAMGLFLLSKILFGGFHFKGRSGNKRPPFMNPAFREKFMSMSEDEKQAFKDQWKQRCGK